jgi:hypothetical protein
MGGSFYALTCGGPDLSGTGPPLNNSLLIVDARNPASPAAFTYASIQGLGGLAIYDGYLFAATTNGFSIYKIQLP